MKACAEILLLYTVYVLTIFAISKSWVTGFLDIFSYLLYDILKAKHDIFSHEKKKNKKI